MADPSAPSTGSERPWRLIYEPARTADAQLAGSEWLLTSVGEGAPPALRWYVIAPTALVLGVGQPMSEVDTAACTQAGVGIVRRASGGNAVLADAGLLNLDVALPAGHPLAGTDVVRAYAWLGEALATALRQLGWAARTVTPEEAHADTAVLRSAGGPGGATGRRACFGGRSPYEVLVSGRKVVGLSQVRRRLGTLYQAGVLLAFDAAGVATLLAASLAERLAGTAWLSHRAAGLADLAVDRSPRALPPASESPSSQRRRARRTILGSLAPAQRPLAEAVMAHIEAAIAAVAGASYSPAA